ncbi:MAG: insulinase family protein [Gemmatimonadota bacterium]|nr:insulinase family protein [Gemmatimonadota bacterium]MDE3126566.1 insulinase family protein [Gemmatimonadota bacterium]MDE3172041.1 insulinase family protein [Gemmatimonadota bacterium]MDE3215649.1 insulinase family protein [Gemmatimonadota bacterium]
MTTPTSRRPSPGDARPYHFPRFQRHRLSGGVQLITVAAPKLPLVSVAAVVDAGAARDPEGMDGLAVLTAKLLLEGTVQREGAELVDAFEQLGASVDITADWDSATVRLTVLSAHAEAAIGLLREVLREPAFRERDVTRLKAERRAEILQMRADPRELADESFERHLYAAGARYSRPAAGGMAATDRITRQAVKEFYDRHYVASRVTLIVAGDLSDARARGIAAAAFGDWTGTGPEVARAVDETASMSRRIRVVRKADAPQSELRIGHEGVSRGHPDYFPLVVMNAVLGGLFSSRINLNLREAHAYTYGAHSGFDWRRSAGPFAISTAVESGVTADAASEVLKEIERIRDAAVASDELSLATSYLAGVFPIRYETTSAIAAALASLVTYGYPDDYFDSYRARIESITEDDVLRVARAHLHPDRLLVVAVGDPAVIEAPLAALNLGPLSVSAAGDAEAGA